MLAHLQNDVAELEELEQRPAESVLAWAVDRFRPRIAVSSAFGPEGVVLIDMLSKLGTKVRVFTLDTGRLPQETYVLMDRVRQKYGLEIEVFFPEAAAVEGMVRAKGVNLFLNSIEDRRQCCAIRKVAPLKRALAGLEAWIVGLRREQSVTRNGAKKVSIDTDHDGIVKISPLVDWTHDQVWDYIREHRVPYNALHDQGYPSVGCDCCSRALKSGEDVRAGRWWWENPEHKECGLHARFEKGAGI